MTKKKIDNSLYNLLISVVSDILPLEYAIRATEISCPEAWTILKDADQEIRTHLAEQGATTEEIDHYRLTDYAWDALQFDRSYSRDRGILFNVEVLEIKEQCEADIRSIINLDVNKLELPAAKYFRICDLLSGNDIGKLLRTSTDCLAEARDYEKGSDIDLSKFPAVLREARNPVHLHPGVRVDAIVDENERFNLSFSVDVAAGINEFEIRRQMEEFLYRLSLTRMKELSSRGEELAVALTTSFLKKVYTGELSEYKITRLDGIVARLAGLLCRDLMKRSGKSVTDAMEAMSEYKYKLSKEAATKNYLEANSQIDSYIKKFSGGH